jgi:hypothetical protein
MGKYDDLGFCRGKNSVIIFSHTKSITYEYGFLTGYMDSYSLFKFILSRGGIYTLTGNISRYTLSTIHITDMYMYHCRAINVEIEQRMVERKRSVTKILIHHIKV